MGVRGSVVSLPPRNLFSLRTVRVQDRTPADDTVDSMMEKAGKWWKDEMNAVQITKGFLPTEAPRFILGRTESEREDVRRYDIHHYMSSSIYEEYHMWYAGEDCEDYDEDEDSDEDEYYEGNKDFVVSYFQLGEAEKQLVKAARDRLIVYPRWYRGPKSP